MRTLLLTAAIVVVAFTAFAANELRSGVWTAELGADGLDITLFQGRNHNRSMMSLTIDLPRFNGLSLDAVKSSRAEVKFALVRAAGVFSFEGHFAGGKGAGHFDFTPDASFLRDMEELGFAGFRDDEIVLFAAEDLTPASLRQLKSMGYTVNRQDLDEIAVFHITPALVREYASLGYANLALRDLVELRVGNVDGTYIRAMSELGFDHLPAHQLRDLGIQGVTPKYAKEMKAMFPGITAAQLEEMRIFNVTPQYIRRMQEIGVRDVKKMIDLKVTGASDVLLKKR